MANANTQIDPMHGEEIGHGNSKAAWAAIAVMMVGFIVGCIAFAGHNPTVVYIGIGIVFLGLIVGWIMKKAGYGVNGAKSGSAH